MKASLTWAPEASPGFKAKKLRTSNHLTRRELAKIAGVSPDEINLFERNLPVPLDARRRILKELWARKGGNGR
jgi:transcriptional regulator with XRE-family HTH domain